MEFAARLRLVGVTVSVSSRYRVRACTHLDVNAAQIEEAVALMRQVASRTDGGPDERARYG
jgi:threonine aldolase